MLRDTLVQRRVLMGGAGITSLFIIALIAVYLKGRTITVQLIDSLRRSKEQEYATLTQTSLDGFLIADTSGRIVDANTTLCTMLGYTQEEALQLNIADFEAIDSPEQIAAHIDAIMAVSLERFQSQFRCKDGTIIEVEISTQYISELSGGRFFTFVRDITERQQAEKSLQKLTLSQEALLSAAPDIIVEVDTHKIITWVNPAGFEFYGDDVIGKEAASFFAGEQNTYEIVQQLFDAKEKLIFVESWQRRQDGEVRLLAWRCKALKDEHGAVIGALSTARDTTEHKQAEQALLQEKLFTEQLLNASGDTILLFEPDTGRPIRWNKHFTEMSGYLDEQIAKMSVPFDLHSENDIWQAQDAVAKIFTDGQCRVELSLITKNGTVIPFEYVVTNVETEDGKTYFLSIGRDITERKQAEEEKVLLESKFQQAQKLESVALLAGGVAHDFNNMLGVILGYTELAMDNIEPTLPLFDDLKKIYDAAKRSATLTRQLLTFARKQNVTPIVLYLNETVAGMLKMLRRLIGEDIDLSWVPGPDLWPIKMDPTQIDQILANLCVNARDAITGVGTITVGTKNITLDQKICTKHPGFAPGDYVVVTVQDSGCGMDKQTLIRIFEPFFTTKDIGEGTGLGLATVYGAIKQNNGLIDVASEPGQGTVFSLYLPRYRGEAGQERAEEADTPAPRGHETILLVEDELSLLNMTATMLQRLGYTVLAANTPSEALRLVETRTGEIHLLATDVIMPGMNGRDLEKQLQATLPGMKSLFISGYTADVIAQHGVLEEGLHLIQKPFSQKDLAAKIREALDSQ